MRIGARKHYITIYTPTQTTDGQGGYVTKWTTSTNEWASYKEIGQARELLYSGIHYFTAAEFEIRRNTNVWAGCKLTYDGYDWVIYEVISDDTTTKIKAYR